MRLDEILTLVQASAVDDWQRTEVHTVYEWEYGQKGGQNFIAPKTHERLLVYKPDIDVSIAMGATVAYGYSLVALGGHLLGWWSTLPDLYFMEATGLLALISLGHWLEARARQSAGNAIRELLQLAPPTALLLEGSGFGVQGSGKRISKRPLSPAEAPPKREP